MNIIVGTPQNATSKFKGDLLESVAGKLLEARGYKIIHKELRKAGCELDLVCQMEANHSKLIYVECKAYDPGTKIQSDAIVRLRGLRGMEGYGEEMWLVTTSELGKDAEGLVAQISNGPEAGYYTFITPDKLIEALVRASIIKVADICKEEIESLVDSARKVSEAFLLITEFGYFWCYEYMPHGTKEGYIFFDAQSAAEIIEVPLLNKLAEISQLDGSLDFSALLNLLDDDRASRLSSDRIALSPSYVEKMDAMKFKILHSSKDELRNSDVFVYPDLSTIDDKKDKVNAYDAIKSKDVTKIVVFGDDLSGKTTLLQQYQTEIADSDMIPIFLNAEDINVKTLDAFNKLLTQKFKDQYSSSAEYVKFFCALQEKHPEKITVLIDDLQNIGIKRSDAQLSLVLSVVNRYPNVIFAVHRTSELEILTKSGWKELFKDFSQFNITQFGHLKRDDLIEKWLKASDNNLDDSEILNSKTDLAAKINIAVGKSFVPTYPFYLLTMLQMLESGSNSIKGTAYGDLYSYLITNALGGVGVHKEDLDFYNTYLANLAYKLFEDDKSSIDLISIERFYEDYLEKMYIEKDFSKVHKLLTRSRLLTEKDDGYSFQFNYVAHYFVAKYLSDNQTLVKDQNWINILVKNLYKDRYANVVIFLIHHSKNTELIDAILAEARSLFEDVNVNMLTVDELTKFNSLLTEQISLTYKDLDPEDNRKNELSYRDELDSRGTTTSDEEINEKLDLFGRIKYSFRLMEVLGQIANNYYGSLDGKTKAEILQVLYDLGLRGMNALLQEYGEYVDGLRDEVKQTIIDKRAKVTDADKLASDIVYSFTQLIVFAFIKKASDSVMSRHLFPVIDKLPIEHDHFAKHLITTAIKLNFPDELGAIKGNVVDLFNRLEKNYLPRDVLRFLVLTHLYKYNVSHSLKQSICDNLEMKLAQPTPQLLT